jgi:hypothetical protein
MTGAATNLISEEDLKKLASCARNMRTKTTGRGTRIAHKDCQEEETDFIIFLLKVGELFFAFFWRCSLFCFHWDG